ncbi:MULTISPECIES: hypothetical protein [Spirulina sp. CCY15215]|uniref:hypothetical protein n=1 Tax=Spirulina sp. CCY15215 TaxID=2767591 RepID=UPI001951EA05|nr:hypothetical protein [Spirulina major]
MVEIHYLIRSHSDGQYLVARPRVNDEKAAFLLLFREHFEALSYLNTHAADIRDRFGVESASQTQLKSIIDRWGFTGVGLVEDPLIPRIQFLST